jgi:hypothetical protein
MRCGKRWVALVGLAAVLGGCGSHASAPRPPRLPRALAHAWAGQADAVAAALAAGDGCTARTRARRLQSEVVAAVNAHRVPARLLEPLSSGVNGLASRIVCVPPPAPPAPGEGHGRGHGQGKHGKGEGD